MPKVIFVVANMNTLFHKNINTRNNYFLGVPPPARPSLALPDPSGAPHAGDQGQDLEGDAQEDARRDARAESAPM